MISLISFLCQQTKLVNEMGRKFPIICINRCSSTGSATKRLVSNRVSIIEHCNSKTKEPLPDSVFYIFAKNVTALMTAVDISFH